MDRPVSDKEMDSVSCGVHFYLGLAEQIKNPTVTRARVRQLLGK
jgi:hypothetical protein